METHRMEKIPCLETFMIYQMAYLLYMNVWMETHLRLGNNFCVTEQFPFYDTQLYLLVPFWDATHFDASFIISWVAPNFQFGFQKIDY